MGELTEMHVKMDAGAWHALGRESVTRAVQLVAGGMGHDRLIKAAELLRAADTFHGRANMAEMLGRDDDEADVDAWDLTDEGFPGEVMPVPVSA